MPSIGKPLAVKLMMTDSLHSSSTYAESVLVGSQSDDSGAQLTSPGGASDFLSRGETTQSTPEAKAAEFTTLKNAIKMISIEAIKAEEVYKAENLLLAKANEQLMKFSRLLQEQDAELAAIEEELSKERKQRESAEKHFIKLKKMMVVKDVEVTEAEQRKKSEVTLRKGAEKEMSMLRRQLQAKESELASTQRKYQKECKKREKYENQMMEISKKAGKQSSEEKYQMLLALRENDDGEPPPKGSTTTIATSKENSFAATNSYEKWKQKELEDGRVASLMEQLSDVKDQLKQTEEELNSANVKFNRERQLREEADKQMIVMREKGFAYHIDRRASARNHAEDCLNTERLKLRNADLHEQYEILKVEAKKTLEKASARFHEEKAAREAVEEQMTENRKHFEDSLDREKEEHQKKLEDLETKIKKATEELEKVRKGSSGTEKELEELRRKNYDYQQQVIDAKAESKKEKTLRTELQAEIKAMEDELDSMERELTNARDALQHAERQHKQELGTMEKELKNAREALRQAESVHKKELQDAESLHRQELVQQLSSAQEVAENTLRSEVEKSTQKFRASVAEANLALLEAKEKIKMLEEQLRKANYSYMTMTENQHEDEQRFGDKIRALEQELEAVKAHCDLLKEKHLEELQAELQAQSEVLKQRHQEELKYSERSVDEKVQILQDKAHSLSDALLAEEARCKLLNDMLIKEQQSKQKSEETAFELNQTVKQLTVELNQATSRIAEAERQSSELRQKVETITANFHKAMTRGESSEQKLLNEVASLRQEVMEDKELNDELRETLERVEGELREERELRQAAEDSLSRDDRSLLRTRREENEQERINMEVNFQALRLSEEKYRTERQQREAAEEKYRSLREEVYRLKHEQVLSTYHESSQAGQTDERDTRIAKLQDEVEMTESHRRITMESLEEERRRREDLEQQIKAFRDMIPEYAAAEERYQKERRLLAEAEATIETLRSKLMDNHYLDRPATQDESTLASADEFASVEARQQVAELQRELVAVKTQCEKAQAALHQAKERYEKELHLREDTQRQLDSMRPNANNRASHSRHNASGLDRQLRVKAEKQVMSLRLKMEAKESEIASLKSRLSVPRSHSTIDSNSSSREKRRPSDSDALNPLAAARRELENRRSHSLRTTTSDGDRNKTKEMRAEEEQHLRKEILMTLPDYVKDNFGRIGFVKHSAFDYWPALVLDPFTVQHKIRTKWLELYYEFHKRDMFIVYLYGRQHREGVNAYPIVEPHHFISYEEGTKRNFDQLPSLIEDKLRYGDQLSEIEEELSDGLTQIRIDARKAPQHRTHPLAETPVLRQGTVQVVDGRIPSMTSTSSESSSSTNAARSDERMNKLESPIRPRSEYSSKSG